VATAYDQIFYNAPNFYNISGTVLVLEHDDIEITNHFSKLETFLRQQQIPRDWNVLRLDCHTTNDTRKIVERIMTPHHGHHWSGATLWRRDGLALLQKNLKLSRGNKLDALLASKTFKGYCLNLGIVVQSSDPMILDEPLSTPVLKIPKWGRKVSMEVLLQETNNPSTPILPNNAFGPHPIDRIYYMNLEKNSLRRQAMDLWLQKQTVPFQRINATVGSPSDQCAPKKSKPAVCRGISGLTRTLLGIMDHENTTGLTMIFEDDYVVTDGHFDRLQEALKMVPDDWDLIRFDCWGKERVEFREINQYVFETSKFLKCRNGSKNLANCWFCGGGFSMLWRGSRVHKL
jgi:GR25 family glycosyltransferase involved in LPS biosynthesis